MTAEERKQQAEKIINKYILIAMGTAVVPIPYIDALSLIGIQLKMVHELSKLYEVDFKEELVKNIILSFIASSSSLGVSLLFQKNKVLNRVVMSLLSGAFTYAIGRVFLANYDRGVKSIIDLNLKETEELFNESFEKGKEEIA